MNLEEVKKIHILDYLHANGHDPDKIYHGSAWYRSPLRNDKTPSFKVDLSRNLWYDFGIGLGGGLLDLVKHYKNYDFRDAVDHVGQGSYATVSREFSSADKSRSIRISRLVALQNPALIQYLKSRKISMAFARRFLKEAYYSVNGKRYFALAFVNDRQGYELRNAYSKNGTSPKFYTTIPGREKSILNVFEGFMDFLSCCTLYGRCPVNTTIVLNSLSFLPRIEQQLREASAIRLFLDNDPAGRGATEKILNSYPSVKDFAPIIYPCHKDFNEFLMARGSK